MDWLTWFQTVGAVVCGALIAGVFFYAFLRVWQLDRQGATDWSRVPFRVLLAWIVPLVVILGAMLSLSQ